MRGAIMDLVLTDLFLLFWSRSTHAHALLQQLVVQQLVVLWRRALLHIRRAVTRYLRASMGRGRLHHLSEPALRRLLLVRGVPVFTYHNPIVGFVVWSLATALRCSGAVAIP